MTYPPHPLTADEAARLLDACGQGWTAVRNRALLAVLYRCGARVGEACGLELCDLRDGVLRIEKPKGFRRAAAPSMPRELGLDPKTEKLIEEWLEWRWQNARIGRQLLFITKSGEAVQTSYIRRLCTRLGQRTSLERRVHPHALRHSFAVELYEESGHDVVLVMRALGHTSLTTTQKYLVHLGIDGVVEATAAREW